MSNSDSLSLCGSHLFECMSQSNLLMSILWLPYPQTWKFPDLHEVENAGPSDSKVEKDLLSVEEFGWKGTDHSTKLEGNGKAPLFGSTEVSYENATGWYHIACGTSFISQWH